MADKAVVTQTTLDAIGQAIIAKGGATAPMLPSEMPGAIASIPTGGGEEWQPPSDWPNIREILDNDTDTTHAYKMILLVDVSLRNKGYSLSGEPARTYKPARIRFSDGRVVNDPEWNYTFEFDIENGKYQWVIADADVSWLSFPDPRYYPYRYAGLLWIYGPNMTMCCYRANGTINVQSIEMKKLIATQETAGRVDFAISDPSIVQIRATDGIYVGQELNGVKSGSCSFQNCCSLRAVPDVLDLSSCTNCAYMFSGCTSLRAVPDVLDLSSCTNCSSMFQNCYSLRAVPDVLDLSSCTNCSNMFNGCCSLRAVPDVLDLSSCTNCAYMFNGCYKLQRIPTHVTVNISLQFASVDYSANYLTDPFETDSIAEFDAGGNIVGGFVYNLNVCPNNGQAITFCNFWKSLFTADQWTAIKAALAAKNWGCSPA